MTRSLAFKLTLAFLFVSLVGAVLASVFIQQRTRSEFNRFLFRQDANELVSALTSYYQVSGGWEGCEQVFHDFIARRVKILGAMPSSGQPGFAPGEEFHDLQPPSYRLPFVLANKDGMILYGVPAERIGVQLDVKELRAGIPLEVNGEVVGYLLAGAFGEGRRLPSPEFSFLQQVNQAIFISTLISVAIALLLGSALARTLTRPIRELTNATQVIAQGNLGFQVDIRSRDELGLLASSFNKMSADLAKSNQLRKQMTADIAHDLRTPLSLILGYTEALSDGKLQGNQEIFSVMHKEANHLSHLIDDLRIISLADAGELPLNRQKISPRALLERAEAAFRPQAMQKNISLIVQAAEDLPSVDVDPERMAQVLGNLLSNALRYTPAEGTITLSAVKEAERVILLVSDTGPGIAPEDLPYVFNRFYRADKSRHQTGESGLGLTIAKSLVEAHGGGISVESQPGNGTTFVLWLPLPKQ